MISPAIVDQNLCYMLSFWHITTRGVILSAPSIQVRLGCRVDKADSEKKFCGDGSYAALSAAVGSRADGIFADFGPKTAGEKGKKFMSFVPVVGLNESSENPSNVPAGSCRFVREVMWGAVRP